MASHPHRIAVVMAGLGLAAIAAAAAGAEPGLVADIYLDRPTVLAFVPAAPPGAEDGDPAVARASAAQALALTGACLGRRPALVQLLVADRIVLHDGVRTADFDIGGTAPLTGIVLAAPKTNPSVLFAGGGPESLAQLAPLAASHYFHLACKL